MTGRFERGTWGLILGGSSGFGLAAAHKLENVALVVPTDLPDGPKNLKIDPKADVTVIYYVGVEVKANHALPKGGLKKDAIDKILKDAESILN